MRSISFRCRVIYLAPKAFPPAHPTALEATASSSGKNQIRYYFALYLYSFVNYCKFLDVKDLTVTLTSEFPDDEVILDNDPLQMSTINTASFIDVQEWKLYNEVHVLKGSVTRFQQVDQTASRRHSFISCRTNASRRTGFYIFSVFGTMVTNQNCPT